MTEDSTERTTHESPHRQQARLALYFIWAFGAALILGVLYVGYLVFDAQGADTGILYIVSMIAIGSIWLLIKTGFGDFPPGIVERQSGSRRLALTAAFALVAAGSGMAMVYYMWPMLYPPSIGDGIGPDQSLVEYLGRETMLAMGLFAASVALMQVVSPRFGKEAESQ